MLNRDTMQRSPISRLTVSRRRCVPIGYANAWHIRSNERQIDVCGYQDIFYIAISNIGAII